MLRHCDGLGQRVDGLEQHHVVEDLGHLPRADLAAIGDVGGKAADQGLDRGIERGHRTDHHAERAVLRRLPGARDRRVGPGRALGLQLCGEVAGLADRRRAEIDHDLAASDVLQNTVALEHRAHVFGARQAEEQHVALPDDIGDRAGNLGAVSA